jgi:hypothetical protein
LHRGDELLIAYAVGCDDHLSQADLLADWAIPIYTGRHARRLVEAMLEGLLNEFGVNVINIFVVLMMYEPQMFTARLMVVAN